MQDYEDRKSVFVENLNELVDGADTNQARTLNSELLRRVGKRLVHYSDECSECNDCIDNLLGHIQDKDELCKPQNKAGFMSYHKSLKMAVSHLQKKHKLVTPGFYMSIYMSVGMALGAGFGAAMRNVALGIPIGLCIGIAIGSGMDADAKKKGLVL